MLFWVVLLIVAIAVVVWLVRTVAGGPAAAPRRSASLHVLEERYARGEIKRDEYLEKKRDIAG
jgi:putative membrane protein